MNDEIEVRPALEIQAAHDQLVAILLREVPNPWPAEGMPLVQAAAEVLCWVLKHEHNQTFTENLQHMEAFFREQGLELRDSGRLQRRP